MDNPSNPNPAQPAPTTGQNPQTTPPPHPDFGKPPAAPGEVRPAPVMLAPDDYLAINRELERLRGVERQTQAALDAAEQQRLKVLAEKGSIEEAMNGLRQSYEAKVQAEADRARQVETQWLGEKKVSAIAEALAGRQFAGSDPKATAAMVRRLLESEVEAVRDNAGNPVVRHQATLRPAADYLKERLESPEFAVFFAATNRGGSGSNGAIPAAPTPSNPSSYDAFAQAYRERMAAYQQARIPGS
jgi:hypothetical protein